MGAAAYEIQVVIAGMAVVRAGIFHLPDVVTEPKRRSFGAIKPVAPVGRGVRDSGQSTRSLLVRQKVYSARAALRFEPGRNWVAR